MRRYERFLLTNTLRLILLITLLTLGYTLHDMFTKKYPANLFHLWQFIIPLYLLIMYRLLRMRFIEKKNTEPLNNTLILTTSIFLIAILSLTTVSNIDSDKIEKSTSVTRTPLPDGGEMRHAVYTYSQGNSTINKTSILDPVGRRKTAEYLPEKRNILLFGDSYTYGWGLDDENTLQYHLHEKTGRNVYNFARSGMGPHHMLYILENKDIYFLRPEEGDVFSDINLTSEDVAFYQLLPSTHTRRARGKPIQDIGRMHKDPFYDMIDGEIEQHGSFFESSESVFDRRKISSLFHANLITLQEEVGFPRELLGDPSMERKDVKIVAHIIERSKEILEEEYGIDLYIIISPTHNYLVDDYIEIFDNLEIDYLRYDFTDEIEDYQISEFDDHPNLRYNSELSELLVDDVFS